MNMRSIITPSVDGAIDQRSTTWRTVSHWLWAKRAFLGVVVAPTLLLAAYFYLVAADQYQSEAHFIVHKADSTAAPSAGFGEILGMVGGSGGTESDAASVSDYLGSQDVVNTLNADGDLIKRFRRPEADLVSRLHEDNPSPEALFKYYKRMVKIHTDRDTGITILQVRAFRPQDAFQTNQRLLQLGEERVNAQNERSYNDAVADATKQLSLAELDLSAVQAKMTTYRQSGGDIDPQTTGEAQVKLVTEMTGNLATARAQLNAMGATISRSSPQYLALEHQVRSLEVQSAVQASRTAGPGSKTTATNLGGFEELRLRQEFAAKRYEATAALLDKARADAQHQQLYLVRVVNPNMPVKALFPERGRILLTVFLGLMLTYSIGWLIAAGVREHAA